jgi:hypothetical protein
MADTHTRDTVSCGTGYCALDSTTALVDLGWMISVIFIMKLFIVNLMM